MSLLIGSKQNINTITSNKSYLYPSTSVAKPGDTVSVYAQSQSDGLVSRVYCSWYNDQYSYTD